ncbi:MAG TPA: hypothetical protein VKQ71_16495, partial [Acidimicrobiales bacterium]|nr:hypothetical protein [Acidimicrobiales bacterium]
PLERQADAARRHGDLVVELRALRRYLSGRELATIEARLAAGRYRKADLVRATDTLRADLARIDADVVRAETELSAARRRDDDADLADATSRAEGMRARARGVAAVLVERRRSVERDRAASIDQGVVANLEAEAAGLSGDLVSLEVATAGLVAQADEVAEAEAAVVLETGAFEEEWGDSLREPPDGAAAEARGEFGALASSVGRGRVELRGVDARMASLTERAARLAEEAGRLRAIIGGAVEAEPELALARGAAQARREAAEGALSGAEAARRATEAEQHRWSARVDALTLALDEARARAGAERLAGVQGVLGTLLELVEVDHGYDAAFEAAAGEALAAVVVDGVDAARRCLELLRQGDAAGAVVALRLPAGAPSAAPLVGAGAEAGSPVRLPAGARSAAPLVGGGAEAGSPVRSHVRAVVPGADELLDRLLAGAVVVEGGWPAALELWLADPDLVVVTTAGDRFAPAGWRTGGAGASATRAAIDEARARATDAVAAATAAAGRVETARSELLRAREAEADALRRVDANAGRLAEARRALARVESDHLETGSEQETLAGHRHELAERLTRDEERVAALEMLLPTLEQAAAVEAERAQAERGARARLAERASAVAALRRDLEVRAAGLEERRSLLTHRLEEVEQRLRHSAEERAEAATRQWLHVVAVATERLALVVDTAVERLDAMVDDLRAARREEAEATRAVTARLDGLRKERSAAERQLTELRERTSRVELDETEAKVRLETLVETIRRELDCEPEAVRDAECPPVEAGTSPSSRIRELERELRLMGPINSLALEEYGALQERHTFLDAQLEDVRAGRRELAKVIRAIDTEIVDVFRVAYADVAENFERLFATLFPGGQARLRLTDPDHLLETGIEVEARPSGKNVRRLSLLSGGERSLTALAFLFAVFRSRPSPFYLMDEVEAALDDVNLHRFLDLVHEFRDEAQLLVVTHQKRTMEAADCLYGVTMQSGGSSRVISERVTTSA